MKIPVIRGVIDRRVLVNFRVDPLVLAPLVPAPFRLKLQRGMGMAGVCLIRLKDIRPRDFPAWTGVSSENAAHRIAVEWEHQGQTLEGVYVPRRDTSSRLNTWAGGCLFPGEQHHARFDILEENDRYVIALKSDDTLTRLRIDGHRSSAWSTTSVFNTVQEASDFFERGALGYSATSKPGHFDGLELHSFNWKVQPLTIDKVESSFFDDPARFPRGSVTFDSALLMTGIEHEWQGRESICCGS